MRGLAVPSSCTRREERQYQHIKESELEQGKSEDRAQEIAARTVNKMRRLRGRTANKTTQGTGNPYRRLESRTFEELMNLAGKLKIRGRAEMQKDELIEAIRGRRR